MQRRDMLIAGKLSGLSLNPSPLAAMPKTGYTPVFRGSKKPLPALRVSLKSIHASPFEFIWWIFKQTLLSGMLRLTCNH